ncbi:MAG: hypothetical protein ACYTET_04240 [Planctomycetota bacterium]|jgi:hypothetical protein
MSIGGILATPGAYERVETPEYDLLAQQERKILLWVECPRSSGADYDVQENLIEAYQRYFSNMMEIEPENLIVYDSSAITDFFQDPKQIARSKGAGYVLMVQVNDFEMTPLQAKDYHYGIIETRSLLMDVDLGVSVWPRGDSQTKSAGIEIELDTKGRKSMMKRLTDAVAHCTLRYLYPCKSVNFKHSDERLTIQEAAEMETF